ncbi:hypothetical protein Aoki45_34350 [Algoriphagus sp. oki45]|uniref:hypothetical protein n=1 Tax=Algoriphagus sp. oki45 TaxID=3067294 RepID=UPI0027F91810|nr:hypothetical protein Aoki45_34350 [Algoriphagus sp. oki45]
MKKFSLLATLAFVALVSCSPSTKILGSWASPEKKAGGYDDVVIIGISESVISRQTFEDQIQSVLTQDGIKASNSSVIIPPGTKPSPEEKEKFAQALRDQGHDAVLTVALLDQTQESRYVPGTTTYSPMMYGGYYRSYWGYYNYYSPMMYDPGYYTTDKNYFLEANLYDVETEQLVWSAQSETTNPANLEAFARTFAMVISDQMIKDGVIVKK